MPLRARWNTHTCSWGGGARDLSSMGAGEGGGAPAAASEHGGAPTAASPTKPLQVSVRRTTSRLRDISFSELREMLATAAGESVASELAPELAAGVDRAAPLANVSLSSEASTAAPASISRGGNTQLQQLRSGSTGDLTRAVEPPPRTPALADRLERDARNCVHFLNQLQLPGYTRFSEGAPRLTPMAMHYSRGLAFMLTTKVGCGFGWTWGHGFCIANLGAGVWSAPTFMRIRCGSIGKVVCGQTARKAATLHSDARQALLLRAHGCLFAGLTFGAQEVRMCHALQTATQMEAFKEGRGVAQVDAAVTLGMDPFDLNAPTTVRLPSTPKCACERAAVCVLGGLPSAPSSPGHRH